jgi:uncharacterized protein (DUF486 family)
MNLTPYILIYIGTIFYTMAAFYHLSFKEWTIKKAMMTAIPLVLIEYIFLLTGNKKALDELNLNPIQILIVTITFYFINIWLLNYFIIKKEINLKREIIAFALIASGFAISQNVTLN